jgi:hypothetical protein
MEGIRPASIESDEEYLDVGRPTLPNPVRKITSQTPQNCTPASASPHPAVYGRQ